MRKPVSKTSTKQAIFEAYEELLGEMKEQRNPKEIQENRDKEAVVTRASSQTRDTFSKHLAELKIGLNKQLDEVGDTMINEIRQLTEIREAIAIEKKNLEELYKIHTQAESLMALIQLQDEKKQLFESEMAAVKETWQKEKMEFELSLKEQKNQADKDRKREEEDYRYTLTLKRRKEQDQFEEASQAQERELAEKKADFEKEIREREIQMAAREKEFEDLKAQAALFPAELEKAVKRAEKSISDTLLQQFEVEKKLLAMTTDTELKLKEQTIQTLEAKVRELENTIKQLSSKNETAEKTVKDIAIKAIESSAKVQLFNTGSVPGGKKEIDS